MKIRNGFVSNSSSSSFCILGVLREEVLNEDMDYVYLDDDSEQCVTGIMLAEGDEGDFSGEGVSFKELKEMVEQLIEKLGVTEDEIKIYSGVQFN